MKTFVIYFPLKTPQEIGRPYLIHNSTPSFPTSPPTSK
jgi:hypothetical protein